MALGETVEHDGHTRGRTGERGEAEAPPQRAPPGEHRPRVRGDEQDRDQVQPAQHGDGHAVRHPTGQCGPLPREHEQPGGQARHRNRERIGTGLGGEPAGRCEEREHNAGQDPGGAPGQPVADGADQPRRRGHREQRRRPQRHVRGAEQVHPPVHEHVVRGQHRVDVSQHRPELRPRRGGHAPGRQLVGPQAGPAKTDRGQQAGQRGRPEHVGPAADRSLDGVVGRRLAQVQQVVPEVGGPDRNRTHQGGRLVDPRRHPPARHEPHRIRTQQRRRLDDPRGQRAPGPVGQAAEPRAPDQWVMPHWTRSGERWRPRHSRSTPSQPCATRP